MAYFVIVVVVLLALAPLWQFLPSRGQRRQARMREAAALAGLFVEFRDLPLPAARRKRLPAAERQVLYYGRRLPARRGAGRGSTAWWREDGGWRSEQRAATLPPVAQEMPPAVLAIGCSDSSCGCYWREEGDLECVARIASLLQRWADELGSSD
jgi:hypothetical protein